MTAKRFLEEFKIEAVKQVTERGYPIAEVARHLGGAANGMCHWLERYAATVSIIMK